ncbi:MAG: DUF2095 family protein [Candidatus Heimdallarchaeota archaeon]|nr:MAG: DUF2095 family protein [Candidatus Heimdallarchaeota archaeon]
MDEKSPKNVNQDQKKKDLIKAIEIDQNLTDDEIREKFPALYKELTDKKMNIRIDEVKSDSQISSFQEGNTDQDPFSNYDPNIYDFLARARTDEEGQEIIDFLANQGQISPETAKDLTKKLKKSGIRSFGPMRPSNYYYRKSEEIKRQKLIQKRYPSQFIDETQD